MTTLTERLAEYTRQRAASVSEADAQRWVAAAMAHIRRPARARHHGRNLASAAALALAVSGVLVYLQVRQASHPPVAPATATIPDDAITLSSYQGYQTFRLSAHTLSAPRSVWQVSDSAQLDIANPKDCGTTVIRVISPASREDVRPPVKLAGCYGSLGAQPLVLPDHTVLLLHWTLRLPGPPKAPGMDTASNPYPAYDAAVRYDWQAGQIVQRYPGLAPTGEVLLSPDARRLYVLEDSGGGVYVECAEPPCGGVVHDRARVIDLQTGASLMQLDGVSRFERGGGPAGRMALSADGSRLYLNESGELLIFDTRMGGQPEVILLNPDHPVASRGPGWVIGAAAKEWGGPSVAVDPAGRWAVSLGRAYPGDRYLVNERDLGFWVVNLADHARVVGYFHRSDGFRAVGASSDGHVIYLLEESGRGRYLLLVDPGTGKDLGEILLCTSTACDGFDTIAGVAPAG